MQRFGLSFLRLPLCRCAFAVNKSQRSAVKNSFKEEMQHTSYLFSSHFPYRTLSLKVSLGVYKTADLDQKRIELHAQSGSDCIPSQGIKERGSNDVQPDMSPRYVSIVVIIRVHDNKSRRYETELLSFPKCI